MFSDGTLLCHWHWGPHVNSMLRVTTPAPLAPCLLCLQAPSGPGSGSLEGGSPVLRPAHPQHGAKSVRAAGLGTRRTITLFPAVSDLEALGKPLPISGPLFPHLGKEAGALGLPVVPRAPPPSDCNSPPRHAGPSGHSPGLAPAWARPVHVHMLLCVLRGEGCTERRVRC